MIYTAGLAITRTKNNATASTRSISGRLLAQNAEFITPAAEVYIPTLTDLDRLIEVLIDLKEEWHDIKNRPTA